MKFRADGSAPPPPTWARSRCVACHTPADPCPHHAGLARYEDGPQDATYLSWRSRNPTSTWRREWLTPGATSWEGAGD